MCFSPLSKIEHAAKFKSRALFLSYYQIKKIIDFSNNNNIFKLKNINIDSFLDSIKNTFDLNIISNLNNKS